MLRELVWALVWAVAAIIVGIIVLPLSIFFVGERMFGSYAGGLSAFYGALLTDLAAFKLTAWVLVLAPAVLVLGVRGLLRRPAPVSDGPASDGEKPRREYREPYVS